MKYANLLIIAILSSVSIYLFVYMNLKNQKVSFMPEQNVITAKAYYQAINHRNVAEAEKYLNTNVLYIGPLGETTGKEAVVDAIKEFITIFKSLTIRAACGSGDQVMLAYDLDCPAPIGIIRTAVLMTFKDNLISRVELFFDARPFERKA
jgi:hypothetical protein